MLPATTRPINAGVIGLGGHGLSGHAQHFDGAGLRFLAFYETNNDTALSILASPPRPIRAFKLGSLLKLPTVEAVFITSPDEFHPEQLLQAVTAGKHVFVEKPLAIDSQGFEIVRKAISRAHQRDLVVSSCHPRRFDPPYLWFKTHLQDLQRQFGALRGISLSFSYHVPEAHWKLNRSLLLDHFPHEIDYLRFLVGDVAVRAEKLKDGFDKYFVAGTLGNDIKFSCAGSRRLKEKIYPEAIALTFKDRTISLNTMTGVFDGIDQPNTAGPLATNYDLRNAGVTSNFAAAVRGTAPSYLRPSDLLVNTISAISLVETGQFTYSP